VYRDVNFGQIDVVVVDLTLKN